MTAQDLITNALALLGVLTPGEAPSADESIDALGRLNRMLDRWSTQRLTIYTVDRSVYALVANTQTYTIGSGATFNQARPLWIANAGLLLTTSSLNVEIPIAVLDDDAWALTGIKTLTSTLPTAIFYTHGFDSSGFGQILTWPVQTTAPSLVLYSPTAVTQIAALSTTILYPPGYLDALEYNLAVRLHACYPATPLDPNLVQEAKDALGDIKRANSRQTNLRVDAALTAGGRRSSYNYRSDTGA